MRGRVSVFGRDPREAEARRNLAYLPESHRAPVSMTGRAWISAQCRAWKKRVDRREVEDFCRSLDLDPDLLDRPLGRCSKGTERKVALAGVLFVGAPLTLLDEPADGLDPRARAALKARLRAARDVGRTILLSSHVLAEVEDLCNRLLVLDGGTLAFDGPPARLRAEEAAFSLEGAVLSRVG
jgi:ABC-2 type transport system ATP-binding protein